MDRCRVPDCNGITDFDDNAQAVLCTTCGTISMQDVLADRDGEVYGNSFYFGPTTLKSLRRVGGALTGQSSKEDRDRRNTAAMHQYIMGLLSKLACSGLAPRAHALFDQARIRGKYRWGRKAVLVAGACVVVVVRENKKGIMMSHLASLMDVSPHSLCRVFTNVNTLLALRVPAFDPVALLPGLQSHLNALISSPTSSLSQATAKMIQCLPPVPVLQLATSLATIINRFDEASFPGASAPATACALLLLALEGQALSALPSYLLLAQELGQRVGARKELVVDRYRNICKLIEDWMEDVPWILGADHPDNRLGKKRRKSSKRDVIAMGLKDVVQFREDILKTRMERDPNYPITVSLEVADEDWDHNTERSPPTEGSITAGVKRKRTASPGASSKHLRLTRSKRVWPLNRLDMASLSLLSPSHPLASDTYAMKRLVNTAEVNDLQTQILTSATFPTGVPPTRLQRLVMARGGEGKIEDEELFEEGELEGFLRCREEIARLSDFFESSGADNPAIAQKQHLLSSPQSLDWGLADMELWTEYAHLKGADTCDDPHITEQILGDWREASPSSGTNVEEFDNFDVHGDW